MIHNDFELLVYLLIASPILYLECKLVHYLELNENKMNELLEILGGNNEE